MLSKRVLASSFYETPCPRCGYLTSFAASHLVAREYRNRCAEKVDYDVISYDVKCQLCLNKFKPTRHRTANFETNPMKAYMLSPLQMQFISGMKSYAAKVSPEIGNIRLNQNTENLKYQPRFDNYSVFLVDEAVAKDEDVYIYITGHNLNPNLLACELGLKEIFEVPISEALNFHFVMKPQILGDVSHVIRR